MSALPAPPWQQTTTTTGKKSEMNLTKQVDKGS